MESLLFLSDDSLLNVIFAHQLFATQFSLESSSIDTFNLWGQSAHHNKN